jgi:hypothetical protein
VLATESAKKMKVFKIKPDFGFQSFFPYDAEDPRHDKLIETGLTMGSGASWLTIWDPPTLHTDGPPLKTGNFAHLWGLGGIAIDSWACEVLQPTLENCELLPFLPYRSEVFNWMNVLERIECLDEEKTKWKVGKKSGKRFGIEEYQFAPERFTQSSLFTLPKDSALLTVTGLSDSQTEFKTIVEREGLTGLKFEEIWSQDGPPIKARGLREILRSEGGNSEPTGTYLDLLRPLYKIVVLHQGPDKFATSISGVTRDALLLFAARCCIDEIGNGGILQLFYNSTGILVPEAIEAFIAVDMPQTADILHRAARPLGTQYPRGVEERHNTLLRASGKTPEELQRLPTTMLERFVGFREAVERLDYDVLTKEFWKSVKSERGGFDLAATVHWKNGSPSS